MLRWRCLRNEVKGVEVNNLWSEEPELVHREAKNMFQTRFQATQDFRVRLEGIEFKILSLETSASLIADFTEEEIKETAWQCDGSKSLGPNGFNFNLIRDNWHVLKQDIIEVVKSFKESGCILKGCNASFITLIPKVTDPSSLDQYRPISLVGTLYKIITKVLSCWVKEVLPLVIDASQSAFLKGRVMLDSVLVTNEVVEELRRNGRRGLCLKVDYEKAYDSVSWEFLFYMLQRLDFHSKWLKWVKWCLESASVSVLVNGSPTREFRPTRGLRLRDLLALFLFLIVVEGLAGHVRQALKTRLIKGVKVGRNEVEVCML